MARLNTWLGVMADRARLAHGRWMCKPEMESVYQTLLRRDLDALGLRDEYYPVGGAANYGLLYLILRCFTELEIGNVLELGAGQSSILIDRLNRRFPAARQVLTLEHDAFWAANIQPKIDHPVLCGNLRGERIRGHKAYCYDWDLLPAATAFDLLLVDGPVAAAKGLEYSRLGALQLLPRLSERGFVVIVDDAERAGERRLAREIIGALAARGRPFKVGETLAAKRQIVIAGGAHLPAASF